MAISARPPLSKNLIIDLVEIGFTIALSYTYAQRMSIRHQTDGCSVSNLRLKKYLLFFCVPGQVPVLLAGCSDFV